MQSPAEKCSCPFLNSLHWHNLLPLLPILLFFDPSSQSSFHWKSSFSFLIQTLSLCLVYFPRYLLALGPFMVSVLCYLQPLFLLIPSKAPLLSIHIPHSYSPLGLFLLTKLFIFHCHSPSWHCLFDYLISILAVQRPGSFLPQLPSVPWLYLSPTSASSGNAASAAIPCFTQTKVVSSRCRWLFSPKSPPFSIHKLILMELSMQFQSQYPSSA